MLAIRNARTLALIAALAAAPLLTACGEEEGPAEQLGKSIDETVEKAGETVEEAGDTMEDAADEMEQKVE